MVTALGYDENEKGIGWGSNGVCLDGRGKVVLFLLGNGVVVLWTGSEMQL